MFSHGRALGGRSRTPLCGLMHVCYAASVVSASLQPHGLQPVRLLCPYDSPGNSSGVGCRALLQGILPTKGSHSHLLHLPALAGGFFITSAIWEGLQRDKFHLDSGRFQPRERSIPRVDCLPRQFQTHQKLGLNTAEA